jgi:hypothetical protein
MGYSYYRGEAKSLYSKRKVGLDQALRVVVDFENAYADSQPVVRRSGLGYAEEAYKCLASSKSGRCIRYRRIEHRDLNTIL